MSWGERSCKNNPCPIPEKCTMSTCNVDCPEYQWDGKTKPDSVSMNSDDKRVWEENMAEIPKQSRKIVTDEKALRIKSKPTTRAGADTTIRHLREALQASEIPGIGICGPQIGEYKRVIFLNFRGREFVLINPEYMKKSKETSTWGEGCLSIPETVKKENQISISRPKKVKMKYMNIHGSITIGKFDGIIGRAVQHEMDHLDGILITDYKEKQLTKSQVRRIHPHSEVVEGGKDEETE